MTICCTMTVVVAVSWQQASFVPNQNDVVQSALMQCPFPACAVEGLWVQYFVYDKQTKSTNYWMTCPHDTCPLKATKAGIAKCIQSATRA